MHTQSPSGYIYQALSPPIEQAWIRGNIGQIMSSATEPDKQVNLH